MPARKKIKLAPNWNDAWAGPPPKRAYNSRMRQYLAQLRNSIVDAAEFTDRARRAARRVGRPLKERRHANRQKKLPKNRTCPICQQIKLNSRQWVLTEAVPMCLSCYRTKLTS